MYKLDLNQLYNARKRYGLSLSEVARRLDKDRSTVWRYEHGKIMPSFGAILHLAEIYGVTVEDLCRHQE